MRFFIFIFLVSILYSCKNETVKKQPIKKIKIIKREPITEGKILKIDTSLFAKFESPVLVSFYERFKNETVWQSSKNRKIVLTEFKNAEDEGLLPEDYRIKKLERFEKKFGILTDKEMVKYDLLLTYNLQKYIWHISQGKLNPKALYGDWDLKSKNTDVNKILWTSYNSKDFQASIDSCKPQHLVYKKLKNALKIISSFPNDTLKNIDFISKISPNDTAVTLLNIKKRLQFWKDLKPQDSITTIYDVTTQKAIKKFQLRHGLSADGVIGKGTIDALNFTKNQRRNQIIANLERWKWYAKDLDKHYLIINIPDYNLRVVKENDTVQLYKVIVGTAKRKTPILTSKLSYAVFNPTWTVPPTIIKEDIIPATLKNRGYLASKNITIYDSNDNEVSATDWKLSKAKGYRYVQSPGTYNSLGMVKIIFPNRFSVYLHDTNHRDYFVKNKRSLSSGCVRVEKPLELVNYILNDSINYSIDKINDLLKTGKTQNASIKENITIYQWYWTAWSENKDLIFRDDIYNLDAELYQKLRN